MASDNPLTQEQMSPVSIDVSNRDQILEIKWEDGHTSRYTLFGLRKNCPCVMCRGGHSQMGTYQMELFFVEPNRRFEVLSLEQVGNHALKIEWDDGHKTGMYRWDLLRHMCPQTWKAGKEGG